MENLSLRLAEILEVKDVNDDDVLQDFDSWDSLTVLSIIATAEADYKVKLTANELNATRTIGDLKELINSKIRG